MSARWFCGRPLGAECRSANAAWTHIQVFEDKHNKRGKRGRESDIWELGDKNTV